MSFRPINRQMDYLFPPSMNHWLPGKHLALFLSLLIYGYATGVFSSRKIERATPDSVALRFIAADSHPGHDTLATFRRRFLKEIEGCFVQALAVLAVAK